MSPASPISPRSLRPAPRQQHSGTQMGREHRGVIGTSRMPHQKQPVRIAAVLGRVRKRPS